MPPRVASGAVTSPASFFTRAFVSGKGHLLFLWCSRDSFSLGLHGDLLRLSRGALGHLDGQHAVLEPRLDLAGVHADRQLDGALEAAEAALLAVPFDLFRCRRLPLSLEGELVVGG